MVRPVKAAGLARIPPRLNRSREAWCARPCVCGIRAQLLCHYRSAPGRMGAGIRAEHGHLRRVYRRLRGALPRPLLS